MSGAELYLVASLVSAGATYAKAKSDSRNLKAQAYQTEIKVELIELTLNNKV